MALNKKRIESGIVKIRSIDRQSSKIGDYRSLLFEMVKGYSASIPFIEPGGHIYRGRALDKIPLNISELTYPESKYVTEMGRANDIGQSMFYGTVGKTIPFYEIKPNVGQYVVMSVWKTLDKIRLNHISYLNEVSKILQSGRELESIFDFVKDTLKIGKLNAYLYNYLGLQFSKEIEDSNDYKITNAIAQLLLTEDIDGILYPTVAMAANAENIVLKPRVVDTRLKFVSAELLTITGRRGKDYIYDIVDSATSFSEDGKINWTGKGLGYTFKGKEEASLVPQYGEYVAVKDGERLQVESNIELFKNLTDIESKYRHGFGNCAKFTKELSFKHAFNNSLALASFTTLCDFESKSFYFALYIRALYDCENLITRIINDHELKNSITEFELLKTDSNGKHVETSDDFEHLNQFYVFSEYYVNWKTIASNIPKEYKISLTCGGAPTAVVNYNLKS